MKFENVSVVSQISTNNQVFLRKNILLSYFFSSINVLLLLIKVYMLLYENVDKVMFTTLIWNKKIL